MTCAPQPLPDPSRSEAAYACCLEAPSLISRFLQHPPVGFDARLSARIGDFDSPTWRGRLLASFPRQSSSLHAMREFRTLCLSQRELRRPPSFALRVRVHQRNNVLVHFAGMSGPRPCPLPPPTRRAARKPSDKKDPPKNFPRVNLPFVSRPGLCQVPTLITTLETNF